MLLPCGFMTSRDQRCKLCRQFCSKDMMMGVLKCCLATGCVSGYCVQVNGKIIYLLFINIFTTRHRFERLLALSEDQ